MTNIVLISRGRGNLTQQTIRTMARNTQPEFHVVEMIGFDIVGEARNAGAEDAEPKRGKYLYFSDNDVYFTPGWLDKMIQALELNPICKILGGQQHPFHGTNRQGRSINFTDAVAGYSMLMTWETWDKYGPFDANAKGVGQSEDFAFCQRIIKDGGLVGYIDPPVVIHCGLTNSDGKPATGYKEMAAYCAKMKKIYPDLVTE